MALSTDITLPRDAVPVFPDLCCRCLQPRLGELLRVGRRAASGWELVMPWLWWFRKPVRHDVPVCRDCRPRMRRHRWAQTLAIVVVVAAAFALLMPWSKQLGLSRQWRRLLTIGGVIVLGAPVWIWFVVRPLAFDLTVRKDTVDFEFGNERYALLFLAANPDGASEDLAPEEDLDADPPGG